MIPGPAGQEVFTVALRDGGDVIALRRSTQSVCRAVGLSGSPQVRLTTVVSAAGERSSWLTLAQKRVLYSWASSSCRVLSSSSA